MNSLLSKFVAASFDSVQKCAKISSVARLLCEIKATNGREAGAKRGDVSDTSFAVNHSRRLARSVAFCGERCRRDGVSPSPLPLLENRR